MRLVVIILVILFCWINPLIAKEQTPTHTDFILIRSISAQAAHEACVVTNNPSCYSILNTALIAYRDGLLENYGGPNWALCEEVSLEAFRSEFNRFFPYQPGLHSLPASEFLGLVLMLKWSCKRQKMRGER